MRDYALVLARRPGDIRAALLASRVDFSRLFASHVAVERAAAQAVLSPELMRAAEHEMARLFGDYSTHVRTWTPTRIEAEWPSYADGVLALQTRLRKRFAWAERVLFPRLGAAPVSAAA